MSKNRLEELKVTCYSNNVKLAGNRAIFTKTEISSTVEIFYRRKFRLNWFHCINGTVQKGFRLDWFPCTNGTVQKGFRLDWFHCTNGTGQMRFHLGSFRCTNSMCTSLRRSTNLRHIVTKNICTTSTGNAKLSLSGGVHITLVAYNVWEKEYFNSV